MSADADGDGQVTKDELVAAKKAEGASDQEAAAFADNVVASADTDGDGKVGGWVSAAWRRRVPNGVC